MMGTLIMDIGYGIKVKSADDKYIKIAEKTQESMDPATDKNIVDIFPWSTYPCLFEAHLFTSMCGYYLVQHVPSWLPGVSQCGDV